MISPYTDIEKCFRLTPKQKTALNKLKIKTAKDLLYHFPSRYEDLSELCLIKDAPLGKKISIAGTLYKLESTKTWSNKIPIAKAKLRDDTGEISVVWFHQPYIATMLHEEIAVVLTGRISAYGKRPTMVNPSVERGYFANTKKEENNNKTRNHVATQNTGIFPIYRETQGITSRWLFYAIQKIIKFGVADSIIDPIPKEILTKYHLPCITISLKSIHSPKNTSASEASRKRFAFEEVFYIQLAKQKERFRQNSLQSYKIMGSLSIAEPILTQIGFIPTKAQIKAIQTIFSDLKKNRAMSRLLEGDVGSGKTLVAAVSAYITIISAPENSSSARLQVAYMAPTEILAKQHFETFINYFKHLSIPIGLITGSGCAKFPSKTDKEKSTPLSRAQFLRFVERGEISVVIGTHALIQKSIKFKHLALTIIDEQHRFGVLQRMAFSRSKKQNHDKASSPLLPHLLSMTATPIPRTLALTIYGDLDLTLLDEMPPGRKPVITEVVAPKDRALAYEHIKRELKLNRQAYIICPRIEEPDPERRLALQAKSVIKEKERLQSEVFLNTSIEILHGKMKPKDRDAIMNKFENGEISILIATSVVEVGVNVPNATTIVIEGAERFGLSQLHQLRGRVLRSSTQAHCFLFTDSRGETTKKRLKALEKAKNGFELAEKDLEIRGAGQLIGGKQWGISDVGMEALKNIKMVEAARQEATTLIENDPDLKKYPLLKGAILLTQDNLHLE